MARLKIADVRDHGFALENIYLHMIDNVNGRELHAWFAEQGFSWTLTRIGSADWVVFDTPAQAIAFKMRWL
ncbi:hypothetical protein [Methylobacterium sp. ID0610]|uniref:hypothetical protein n=1 Tax=Methylobacterium carpenticola TaxID=3344827 RepID=UPI00367536B2